MNDQDLTPSKGRHFSLHHHTHASSAAHLDSNSTDIRGSHPRSKAERAWSWPLTSV